MPMDNLIKYCKNYSKTSRRLWQYRRDKTFLDDNGTIADFPAGNKTKNSRQNRK